MTQERPSRQQFDCRVRLAVSGRQTIVERYAANLSEGGMFIRDDRPPPVGSVVLIEFVLPDGQSLSRAAARVVHSRPATMEGDTTAGMGLQFVQLDALAQEIVEQLNGQTGTDVKAKAEPEQTESRLFDLRGLEAPLLASSGPILGIDLGTVNSCVAVVKANKPHVVLGPQGYDVVPSVVFVSDQEEVFVGHKALERMILQPHRAIYGSKRFLGRPFISKEVQTYGHFFNYDLVAGQDGRTAASVDGKLVPLEVVGGHILSRLRQMAELHLGCNVGRAVITVPAYFGETQRQAVRDAGRIAGLNVERILNEPTAAAIAYGFGRNMKRTILVYDLGGGTFDATVLRIKDDTFEVLATDGDPFLGGSDFDDRLTEFVLSSFERLGNPSLRRDAVAVQRVRFAVELAKCQLSEATSADIDLPYIAQGSQGPLHLQMKLPRDLFERLVQDLVDRTFIIVQEVLDRAKILSKELDDVLLVGGQSRSPLVRQRLFERFAQKPSSSVHPTEAVALGAAIVAEALHSDLQIHMADILPATIRLGRADGGTTVLISRGERLPVRKEFEVPSEARSEGIRVSLYRGELERTDENTFLGSLVFPTSQNATTGGAAKVVMQVSGDGLLSMHAFNPATGEHRELDLLLNDN